MPVIKKPVDPKRHTLRVDLNQLAKSYGLEPPYDFHIDRSLLDEDRLVLEGNWKA